MTEAVSPSSGQAANAPPSDPRLPVVREVVLVEGRYDAHAVRNAVSCTVLETGGFGIFRDEELKTLLRRLAEERGLIVLTDSDGAGFVIRNHLRGILPANQVKHAYIPEIPGKERRKHTPGREGLLGVEGMDAETLRRVILQAATPAEQETPGEPVTKCDFYEWGLSGTPEAAARRGIVLRALGFPARMSANALLAALAALYDRDAAAQIVRNALET